MVRNTFLVIPFVRMSMLSHYVQLTVDTDQFDTVKQAIEDVEGWYVLREEQQNGILGLTTTSNVSSGYPLSGVFFERLGHLGSAMDPIFWVAVYENTDRTELTVYQYDDSDEFYQKVANITEGAGAYGEDICSVVKSEYDIKLLFDWEAFANEYSLSRDI